MLCVAHCGLTAYMDDGEAQDNSVPPFIDFLRDPLDKIKAALHTRNLAAFGAALSVQSAPQTAAVWSPLESFAHEVAIGAIKPDELRDRARAALAGRTAVEPVAWQQGGVAPKAGFYWAWWHNSKNWSLTQFHEGYLFAETTRWAGPVLPPDVAAPPAVGETLKDAQIEAIAHKTYSAWDFAEASDRAEAHAFARAVLAAAQGGA